MQLLTFAVSIVSSQLASQVVLWVKSALTVVIIVIITYAVEVVLFQKTRSVWPSLLGL